MKQTSFTSREIADTGVKISALSLGTVKFGRNQSVKYPSAFSLPDDEDINELLAMAFDNSVNTLDTAPAYGISEERIGKLLKHRQSWHIITKAGEVFDPGTNQSHYDFTPKNLRKSLESSLKKLKTDYIDCWLLHSDGNDLPNLTDEVIQVFQNAKQEGLVRSIGASTKTLEGGEYALKHMDCIMMAASLDHTREAPLFSVADKLGKSILLKKIFDSGWALSGSNKNDIMSETYKALFCEASACSAIVGTINPAHLQENIAALQNALEGMHP